MPDVFSESLVQRFNLYCQELGKTELVRKAFQKTAAAIASQLPEGEEEHDRLFRCREWLRLALSEEFRCYAPSEAIRSVAGSDNDGILKFLPEPEDAPLRNVLRLLGLNLLVNKIASGEVLVTTAGRVASGKTTLICGLSGMNTSHLRSDEKGQSVVTLLVTPGASEQLIAMPLSGGMQGRATDVDSLWGDSSKTASEKLASLLRIRPGEPIPLADSMQYFADLSHGDVAARLACLKLTRPATDGRWSQLAVSGGKVTLLDARGFGTIAADETTRSGRLFAQGAEVPILIVSLEGIWDEQQGAVKRVLNVGNEEASYIRKMVAVLGPEMAKRMVVVFTFLSHLKGSGEAVPDAVMTRRVCDHMGTTIDTVCRVLSDEGGVDPSGIRWLLMDDISLPTPERRMMFWEFAPSPVRASYQNSEEQFSQWFGQDGGSTGLCSAVRETIEGAVLPQRHSEANEIFGLFKGRLPAIFNDTFPHIVPEYRELFRDTAFMDFTRRDFNDRLDTQQLDGAARGLLERINSLGVRKAHEGLWASCMNGDGGELDLDPTSQMLVKKFYLGAFAGMSAFVRTRCDSEAAPGEDRVVQLGVASFADILDSVSSRDGEGTKEHLKDCLRETTGRVREAFTDYSPMAQELCDSLNSAV